MRASLKTLAPLGTMPDRVFGSAIQYSALGDRVLWFRDGNLLSQETVATTGPVLVARGVSEGRVVAVGEELFLHQGGERSGLYVVRKGSTDSKLLVGTKPSSIAGALPALCELDGHLFVADGSRLVRMTASGEVVATAKVAGPVTDLVCADGSVFALLGSDDGGAALQQFSADLSMVKALLYSSSSLVALQGFADESCLFIAYLAMEPEHHDFLYLGRLPLPRPLR